MLFFLLVFLILSKCSKALFLLLLVHENGEGTENEEISHCWGWDFLVARIYIIDLYRLFVLCNIRNFSTFFFPSTNNYL